LDIKTEKSISYDNTFSEKCSENVSVFLLNQNVKYYLLDIPVFKIGLDHLKKLRRIHAILQGEARQMFIFRVTSFFQSNIRLDKFALIWVDKLHHFISKSFLPKNTAFTLFNLSCANCSIFY
jgi:hypothetical protein